MRPIILILLVILSISTANGQGPLGDTSKVYVTVVRHDNQHPHFEYKTDTLVKDTLITKLKADLYFTHRLCHFPYYMPTFSMTKNIYQDKECNMKIYPRTVKCYQYDSLKRVTRMQVEGSGTRGYWFYKYDNYNRVIELKRDLAIITMTYNKDGTLAEIKEDHGDLQKQFYFFYKTSLK
ncbi:MAG: hypothetical protein V4580_14205 [Bacteroidota bacterium]